MPVTTQLRVLLAASAFLTSIACGGRAEDLFKVDAEEASVKVLVDAFVENELRADARWKGKRLAITGRVKSVAKTEDAKTAVEFKDAFATAVVAEVPWVLKAVATLERDERVELWCTIAGFKEDELRVNDCVFSPFSVFAPSDAPMPPPSKDRLALALHEEETARFVRDVLSDAIARVTTAVRVRGPFRAFLESLQEGEKPSKEAQAEFNRLRGEHCSGGEEAFLKALEHEPEDERVAHLAEACGIDLGALGVLNPTGVETFGVALAHLTLKELSKAGAPHPDEIKVIGKLANVGAAYLPGDEAAHSRVKDATSLVELAAAFEGLREVETTPSDDGVPHVVNGPRLIVDDALRVVRKIYEEEGFKDRAGQPPERVLALLLSNPEKLGHYWVERINATKTLSGLNETWHELISKAGSAPNVDTDSVGMTLKDQVKRILEHDAGCDAPGGCSWSTRYELKSEASAVTVSILKGTWKPEEMAKDVETEIRSAKPAPRTQKGGGITWNVAPGLTSMLKIQQVRCEEVFSLKQCNVVFVSPRGFSKFVDYVTYDHDGIETRRAPFAFPEDVTPGQRTREEVRVPRDTRKVVFAPARH